eukprot:g3856.t1
MRRPPPVPPPDVASKYKVDDTETVPSPTAESKGSMPLPEREVEAAIVVQRNIRGHLSRKGNEGVQTQLRKAKYLRSKGWDRPPSPIVVVKQDDEEAKKNTIKAEETPLDKSRVQALTEQIKKLNMEKDMLLNKNKKLRNMLTHEKRKSGKAEAELFRANKKMKEIEAKITSTVKAHNSTGKAKREADMRYLKLEKTLEESVKEKAELVLEIERISKARKKAMKMYEQAENELQKLQDSTGSSSANLTKRPRVQRDTRDTPDKRNTSENNGKETTAVPVNSNKMVASLQITIQSLRDDLETTLRDKVRAEQGFREAMRLYHGRRGDIGKIRQIVDAMANEVNNSFMQEQEVQFHNNTVAKVEQQHSFAMITPVGSNKTHSKETTPQRLGEPRNERYKSPKDAEKRSMRQKVERRNMQILRKRSLAGTSGRNRLPEL